MRAQRFAFGPFVLNPEAGTLLRQQIPVAIGHRGLLLLAALTNRPGEVLAKSELMDAAWPGTAVEESNLSVQIAALRKLLGSAPDGADWIATVPRVGYRFTGEVASLEGVTSLPLLDALPTEVLPVRKMAAIMVSDVVAKPAMTERGGEQTEGNLAGYQTLVSEKIDLLGGHVFKTVGDAAFAEFPSALNALRAAVEIRSALAGAQESSTDRLRMQFGLHIADVYEQGDELVGDGIDLTARIQAAAEPGSIYLSGDLFAHVRRNPAFLFDDIGERTFKDTSEPVQLYRVRGDIGAFRFQTAPTQLPAAKERRPSSIAILPFRTSSEDEDQRYLADGLTDELIVELGRFRRLSVSSRSASFAVAEANSDPVKVGDALAVQYVLEGKLRRIGSRVLINLTLSETEQGAVIWSDKIKREFEDILDAIDETVAKIAATVSGRMEDAAVVATRRKPPEDMTAFDCVLRGLDNNRLGGVTDENAREAVRWFTKAIEADPNYAAAYAWRVCAGSWLPDFDWEQGRRDVQRALELDPCDAEANRIMGTLELIAGNFDQSIAHGCKAMELNPTDAYIRARCAAIFTFAGEAERSLVLLDEAETLDPFLPVFCVEERGVALYALGRFAEAVESLGKLTFQTNRSRLYRAAALMALGRGDEAGRLVREAIAGKPELTASGFTTGERYRDPKKARELGRLLGDASLPQ